MPAYQLLFFDVSGGEFMVILIAIFFIFGPKKMPEIARKIGRTMNELKKASSDITREFKEETNSIKNELLAARESVRRETETITRDITEPLKQAGTEISKEIPADMEPYLQKKDPGKDEPVQKESDAPRPL
ncbi:MAG: sec-independent protein translocase protein TatB [Bacteroidetes bacterium]|nr:MAG: sec-independent protein translocase protein TatB [Bacteroidota bacterium]